jgi:hypothetical protein
VSELPPYLVAGWRRAVPDITVGEITTILPILQRGDGRLRALVAAYRAGRRAQAAHPAPLSGFQPCTECLSTRVASLVLGGGGGIMARCADCDAVYPVAPTRADAPIPLVPYDSERTVTDG